MCLPPMACLGLPEAAEHRQCWEAGGGSVSETVLLEGSQGEVSAAEEEGEAEGSAAGDVVAPAGGDSAAEEGADAGSASEGSAGGTIRGGERRRGCDTPIAMHHREENGTG